jgi:RHS repeat-associated protein
VTEPDPVHGNVDTNYTYDTLGRLTVVSMPRGTVTQTRTFTYDGSSQRLLSSTNPENGTVSYGYKKKVPDGYGGYTLVFDGLLHTRTDAKGQKVEYDYDLYGRVFRIRRFPTAQGVEDPCQGTIFYYDMNPYGYDPSHNTWGRVAVAEWGGTVCAGGLFRESYTYNRAGQKTGKTLQVWRMFEGQVRSASLSAAWTYDNWGRVQTVRFPGYYKESGSGYAEWANGAQRQYTYNAMGQLTQLTENGMARVALAEYHPSGQLKRLDHNYQAGDSFFISKVYDYNARGQLTRITSNGSVAEYQYATLPDGSDNNGQIRREIAVWSGAQTTYTYDSLHRLSSWTSSMYGTEVYSYDGFGNRTDVPYGANAGNNRIAAYTHDANGNVTGMPNLTLEYDVENRIRRATHAANGVEEYLYDPANQRIAKGDLVTFYDVFGKRMAQYKLGNPGWTGEPRLAFYVEGNVTMYTYFQGMALGSNRLGSMGAQFNPYGVPKTALAEGDGFATYWRDQKSGLDYAINRYYHSALGRFVSPDPVEPGDPTEPQSWNYYAYVLNDPINFNDPEGLIPCGDIIIGPAGSEGPTLSAFLNTNTDMGLLAITVFVESAMRNTASGAQEMGAIASVVMNRYNIVNGHIKMVRSDGSVQAAPRGWGVADGSLRSILNPSQFEVWQGPGGTLSDGAQDRLDTALRSDADSDLCKALLNATGTASIALRVKNTATAFVNENGLIYTGFNSFPDVRKYDWEQAAGQYGSANRFYGIRLPLPVSPEQPISRGTRPRLRRNR